MLFILLPITHEQTTVRRLPWVSLTIAAACLIVFVFARGDRVDVEESHEMRRQALVYFVDHPYLEPDPRLLPPAVVEQARRELPERARRQPADGAEQRRLDRLTGDWVASLDDNLLWKLSLVPDAVRPTALVTSFFTHYDVLHLLGNLLFLYLTAPFVEDRFGRLGFTAFYLAGGLVSGAAFCLHYPHLFAPLMGASGAVAASMGAFLVLFGRVRVRFLYTLFVVTWTFTAPAWLMLPLWFVYELVDALEGSRLDPSGFFGGVAYWAHVWGFVFGAAVGLGHRYVAGRRGARGELGFAD